MNATLTRAPFPIRPSLAALGTGLVVLTISTIAARSTPLGPAEMLIEARSEVPFTLAPGTDVALLLATAFRDLLGLQAQSALRAASWLGLPILAAVTMLSGDAPFRRAGLCAAAACMNPLTLWSCAAGYGLAATGFVLLWTRLLDLAERPPHLGMAPAGLGIAAVAAFAPGFSGFALPLFAILFLAAPPDMARRHMLSVYLIAFVPVAAWIGTLSYAAWLSGAEPVPPLAGVGVADDPFLAGIVSSLTLAALCAPGLALRMHRRPMGGAALVACALAATGDGVPLTLALLGAGVAQAASVLRGEASPLWLAAAAPGALGALLISGGLG